MLHEESIKIDKKNWNDVKYLIAKINPEFFEIVETIKPEEKHSLYRVDFPYGDLIGDHISQFLPLKNGGYIRLNDPKVPIEILKDLGYGKNNSPIGMVLNKKFEWYKDLPEKKMIFPFMVQSSGDFFSYHSVLDLGQKINYAPNALLSATAGGKTCFMLPSINCQNKFSKLCRELNIKEKPPQNLYEHSNLFKKIIKSPNVNCDWHATLLYFSETWVEDIQNNPKWYGLKQFFHRIYVHRALFPINMNQYNTAFSLLLEKKNLKPNPYILDTFKHLIQIICGYSFGQAPLGNNELLPLDDLQMVFNELYDLGNISPTIMGPSYFDLFSENPHPVYYSLQMPIKNSFSPKSKKASAMVELKELHDLCENLLHELCSDQSVCADTIIHYLAKSVSLSFHHNSEDIDNIIAPSSLLVDFDKRFNYLTNHSVAENAKFLRGCVRISK